MIKTARHLGFSIVFLANLSGAIGGTPASEPTSQSAIEHKYVQFAKELETDMAKGSPRLFDTCLDIDSMVNKATSGLDLAQAVKKDFREDTRKHFGLPGTILVKMVPVGGYRFLGMRQLGKERIALFRLLMEGRELDYHGIKMSIDAAGRVRILDVYLYTLGAWITDGMRRNALLFAATRSSAQGKHRAPEEDLEYLKTLEQIVHLSSADSDQAMQKLQSMPDVFRKLKPTMATKIALGRSIGPAEHRKAIEEYVQSFPNDPSCGFHWLSYWDRQCRFDKAIDSINAVDKLVGGDPYLDILRALGQQDLVKAKAMIKNSLRRDPYMVAGRNLLLGMAVGEHDYAEACKQLTALQELRAGVPSPQHSPQGKDFDDFWNSTEYKLWLKSQQKR